MSESILEKSYLSKILFYLGVLMLPGLLMTLVIVAMPDSALSPLSDSPSRFLFFLAYFLPGLLITRTLTDSWRKTIGIGFAYIIISPAYYFYAMDYACRLADACVEI